MSLKFLSRSVAPVVRGPLVKLLLSDSMFFRHRRSSSLKLPKHPPSPPHACEVSPPQTIIFDVEGWLLRSSSTFPYFMLVAFEAGGLFRALLLLVLYPLLRFMGREVGMKLMVMVCFVGVKKEKFRIGRAVLSKWFMEDVGEEGFEVVKKGERRVGVSSMPRVMVESFLKDYLEIEMVIGRDMKEFHGFYTGFMEEWDNKKVIINGGEMLGLGCYDQDPQHTIFSCCKEVHRVSKTEKKRWHSLPREKYPKPLIFHDGRLAFRPTPTATFAMFMWLPFGITLSVYRTLISILLPISASIPICALTGMVNRLAKHIDQTQPAQEVEFPSKPNYRKSSSGRLYICNHRTLLDPIYISATLNKKVIAVIYSLSPVSEFLSPIKTARLTRNKEEDRKKMEKLLKQGDLVVCPEGTTCREPYLLRFSPLFAELADEITPVALKAEVSMFYGTTAGGFKWMDSFYFLMNPHPKYVIQFLERIPILASDNERNFNPYKMANLVQSEIGRCLDFKCTTLTRKDKYQMLAGNDGVVQK